MEKPVIALNNGGTRELVDHNRAGLLSEPHDIDQLATNILTLLNDPDLRARLGRYGRQRCIEYFNPQRMADEVEQIYRRILGVPHRVPAVEAPQP